MPTAFEVVYLDHHLMVVSKEPGLLVQADATGDPDLLRLAREYLKKKFEKPGNVFLGLVHRLDRPASGVVVLARTSKSAARLSDQFRRRTPEKDYLAIVEGSCPGAGILKDHLIDDAGTIRIVESPREGSRDAELQWHSLAEEDGLTLVAVRLKTGRKHQIRVQLSGIGHPVLGDFRYGASQELDGRNLALHAHRLALSHPTRKEWMVFKAAPPAAWGSRFDEEIRRHVQQ